ncbi:hypothetical protein OS493_036558 [Desmophyllum pertusum]|uniref:SEA domain-containing protein n=1 Tax=Desmophyllum pertusum TaxID=174260 RepID=A0A9W9YL69_9CNID|nr:hypothetical protein OS493_036558 [Desmophyllum pertusum]
MKTSVTIIAAASTTQEIRATSSIKDPVASSSISEVIPTSDEQGKSTEPSTTSKEPQTQEPATEEPESELIAELHIEMKWNDDLEDENSAAFKELSQVFEKGIQQQYSQNEDFVAVKILSFKTKRTKDLLCCHHWHIMWRIFCPFPLRNLSDSPLSEKQRLKRRRVSDGIPTESSFTKAEKYELEDKKEDIVRYEEVEMSAIAARYEESGIRQNQSARYEKLDFSKDGAGHEAMQQ